MNDVDKIRGSYIIDNIIDNSLVSSKLTGTYARGQASIGRDENLLRCV